jgi:F-type H+-transporting ATPase subunit delta
MRPSATARRYAEASFDVAREDGDVERWLSDLTTAVQQAQDPNVDSYFKDPSMAAHEKLDAVPYVFPKLHPYVQNLLRELVSRHRLHLLPSVVNEFTRLEREAQGLADAFVTVARPLTDAEGEDIARRIGEQLGKRVSVHVHVEPTILGGIVVRVGDRLFDASVATKLQRLRQEMAL